MTGRHRRDELRVAQRRPQACQECTRRKIKCNKGSPCDRCIRSGRTCQREVVLITKAFARHRDELHFLSSLLAQVDAGADLDTIRSEVSSRIDSLQHGHTGSSHTATSPHDSPLSESNERSLVAVEDLLLAQDTAVRPNTHPATADNPSRVTGVPTRIDEDSQDDTSADVVSALEYLGWGRHYGSCYPHRGCSCYEQRSPAELISINCNISAASISLWSAVDLRYALPITDDCRKLVTFHLREVLWHHNAIHAPTFLKQCEIYWNHEVCDHPLWMALYLAIMSTTAWSVQNTKGAQDRLGMSVEPSLSEYLFSTMIDVLNAEKFLENLSLYSVQAIVISTRVAHGLGLSQLNATLIAAAIRIAQCLGLHKISDSMTLKQADHYYQYEMIEREVGRRTWWQLVLQDHFSIQFTDSYLINPSHFSTSLPRNCDDHTLLDLDVNIPTSSSYVRVSSSISKLVAPLLDSMGPVGNRKPAKERYQLVLKADSALRHFVTTEIPDFLVQRTIPNSEEFPWLDVARRSLAISAADKIIMLHRPFLLLSFRSAKYIFTRRTCIAAALTILRQQERSLACDDILVWTHSAFTITASVTLGLELIYGDRSTESVADEYRSMIREARDQLAERQGDAPAQRGVRLIDTILHFDNGLSQVSTDKPAVSPMDVLAKFIAMNNPSSDAASSTTEEYFLLDEVNPLNLPANDFNEWFFEAFGV